MNVNANANANANAAARAGLNARDGGDVFVSGGGSAYFTVEQPYPTVIQRPERRGRRVRRTVRVPYEARRAGNSAS